MNRQDAAASRVASAETRASAAGGFSRYFRASALDILGQDYIKVTRAKGLPERLVLIRRLAGAGPGQDPDP